jgi:Cd2+/Zn2+-exporting ATPase/Cu+-exporting ATPase
MPQLKTIDVPVQGMDCAECVQHVRHAIDALPGVSHVEVYLASERATVQINPEQVDLAAIRAAVAGAGYRVPEETQPAPAENTAEERAFARRAGLLLAGVVGFVLFVIVLGEWLGVFERLTERVPLPVGIAFVAIAGFTAFRNVWRATLRRQITAHHLMTLGVIAALAVGQWATALVVVFLMHVGDFVERFTAARARRAVKDLAALAPATARVWRDETEVDIPADQVRVGETVIVRPGEQIPVDGEVIDGRATINQAAITGEPLPVDAGPGSLVYAATIAELGHLRVCATKVGRDATFGKVVRMVEEAEARRGRVQTAADRFAGIYLPIVAGIAALTFIISRNPLATAAVLVVACSCSFALATPIAMLASIGAAARRGLLIKGGQYIESLARADVLLIDKTGTLTLGQPRISEIVPVDGVYSRNDVLSYAASAERYSEHPLAQAVREAAARHALPLFEPQAFEALPGQGIRATIDGRSIVVGNRAFVVEPSLTTAWPEATRNGKTTLYVAIDGQPAGLLSATDTMRSEVPDALHDLRELGLKRIELLTGDNEQTARALADELGIAYRANLLPEDKIRIVREYQQAGHTVVMIGDGVNDAPALAQADVGVAMAVAGAAVAVEAAHVSLMREDWRLAPELFRIARRTMRVVRLNLAFTTVYNIVGISLAAFGILPPMLAAAAQSIPDLGILGNSARLLRQK